MRLRGTGVGRKGAYLIFPKSWSDMIVFLFKSMYVSVSQKSHKDPVSLLKELRNITRLLSGSSSAAQSWLSFRQSTSKSSAPLP